MQKLLGISIGLSAALLASITPALGVVGRWVKVAQSEQGTTISVDANSIQGRQRYRYYWTFTDMVTPIRLNGKPPAYILQNYQSADCQTKLYRTRAMYVITDSDRVLKQQIYDDRGKLQVASPGSLQAAAIDYACRGYGGTTGLSGVANRTSGQCNNPWDIASDGSRCGRRAASERQGGRTGNTLSGSSSSGSTYVNGYFRNGSYVRGYTRSSGSRGRR